MTTTLQVAPTHTFLSLYIFIQIVCNRCVFISEPLKLFYHGLHLVHSVVFQQNSLLFLD